MSTFFVFYAGASASNQEPVQSERQAVETIKDERPVTELISRFGG